MRARRDAAIRLFKVMLVASIAVPVAIFSYAAWLTYKAAFVHADEQLSSTLDIMSEQANKVFQSVDLTFNAVNAIVGGMSDDEIRTSEHALHLKLHELEKATNAVDAIFISDKTGHPMVSSSFESVPSPLKPNRAPAPSDRSNSRSALNGPRSLMVTLIERWFFGLETRIKVPIGKVLCAACQPMGSKVLPVETSLSSQYIDATTHCPA